IAHKFSLPGKKRIGLRSPACVKFMHSDEKSQLNFIELARDLTHRGCAVLPKLPNTLQIHSNR
ncbi:MAG: hypothetical protein IKO27_00855, partial [Ruminococcus sp.]|nr:hypothetical protein [Ruminococcus sp.]